MIYNTLVMNDFCMLLFACTYYVLVFNMHFNMHFNTIQQPD